MTMKEALQLKRGDRVGLTRDDRVWRVSKVRPEAQYVQIKQGDDELDLRGAAALRSLKRIEK